MLIIKKLIAVIMVTVMSGVSLSTMGAVSASERRGMTAGNLTAGGGVAESEGNIYFLYQGSLCVTQQGSDEIRILTPNINDFLPHPYSGNVNVMDEWIYFKTLHGYIYRIPERGGVPQLVLAGLQRPLIGVNEFIIVDGWIYYNYELVVTGMERASKLCRMPLDGGEEQVLLSNGDIHWLKNVTGGYIYYSGINHEESEVRYYRLPVSGGQAECLDSNRWEMQIEGEWVYYLDRADHKYLRRASLDGTVVEDIYVQESCMSFNISGDWIYTLIGDYDAENLDKRQYVRIRTDGSEIQKIGNGEIKYQQSVAGDVISSRLLGTMRIRENDQGIWLEKIEAGLLDE